MKIDTQVALSSVNIAEHLDEKQLKKIGEDCARGYETDLASRKEWEENHDKWTKMALQVADKKTYPWTNASNVKFPILSTASMQFAARAYPTLVPSTGEVVNCRIVGADPDGRKEARAIRISKHMSYQVMQEMQEWEEDMDRLLIILPIAGTVFKKTYFDSELGRNYSCLIYPKNLVVNYWAKTLEKAERKTEVIEMSKRRLREKQLSKLYLDIDLPSPSAAFISNTKVNPSGTQAPETDETTPYVILEQHTWIDLDDDGYPEPYVVVFEKETEKVLRISARFSQEGVETTEDGEIKKITPIEYYTKFSFFPNPDGGFYDLGFGRLLGSINASVDTLINQLIDAGTLSNLQSGFIGKGLRIKMGDSRFQPGEWKAVNATGDDIKKQIFPLPVREPSEVLFKLLDLLNQSAKELASIAEIFTGKMPGQNTPATTTMASVQEGMRLFTAIYKRIYRSMTEEFRKMYKLNSIYLDLNEEVDVLDEPLQASDYQGNPNDIVPAADPDASSKEMRTAKAERLLNLLALGTINPQETTQRVLTAYEEPNIEKLMGNLPPPPPDPKMEAMKLKAQLDQNKQIFDQRMEAIRMQMENASEQQKMQLRQEEHEHKMRFQAIEAFLNNQLNMAAGQQQVVQSAQQHAQSMQQSGEQHQQKLQQARQQPKKEKNA